jgi:23S rRNA pseudouridine2605 synthase
MGEATGFRVMRLSRLAFAGVTGEGLRPGEWRHLTYDELSTLKKEYGVPKRVFSPPVEPKGARPRAQPMRWTRGGAPAGGGEAGGGGRHAEEHGGERKPRYGGGAPARRDLGVREDWGGGVRRGSSGERDEDRAPREDVGGRGGRTRTTGTGGGIGARDGSYRVRGRHG